MTHQAPRLCQRESRHRREAQKWQTPRQELRRLAQPQRSLAPTPWCRAGRRKGCASRQGPVQISVRLQPSKDETVWRDIRGPVRNNHAKSVAYWPLLLDRHQRTGRRDMRAAAKKIVQCLHQSDAQMHSQRARGAAVGWNVVRLPCLCRYSPQSEVQAVVRPPSEWAVARSFDILT